MSRHRYGTNAEIFMPPTTLTSRFGYLAGRLGGPLAPEDMALRINCLGAEGRYAISELAMELKIISASVSNPSRRVMAQNCWCFIAFVTAGCRGMLPNERWR